MMLCDQEPTGVPCECHALSISTAFLGTANIELWADMQGLHLKCAKILTLVVVTKIHTHTHMQMVLSNLMGRLCHAWQIWPAICIDLTVKCFYSHRCLLPLFNPALLHTGGGYFLLNTLIFYHCALFSLSIFSVQTVFTIIF